MILRALCYILGMYELSIVVIVESSVMFMCRIDWNPVVVEDSLGVFCKMGFFDDSPE